MRVFEVKTLRPGLVNGYDPNQMGRGIMVLHTKTHFDYRKYDFRLKVGD